MRYPGFVGPSYTAASKLAAIERCVNLYPEQIESPGGSAQYILLPTPGWALFCTLPKSPLRGFYSNNGRSFAVAGDSLYELFAGGTFQERGSGLQNLDGAAVTFASNGDGGHQLLVTAGSKGYLFDLNTNVLTFVVDGANQCGFLDGFLLALDSSTSTLKVSALEDGSTWDPLDRAQRNAGADRWSGMIVANKQIWLSGSLSTELWYDAGGSFPFSPNSSVLLNVGNAAPQSFALLNGSPIWLGQTEAGPGPVYYANGYDPVRVSNHAVETAIAGYAVISDAKGWTYQENGHEFYVLTFPTAGATWVYDRMTGAWHERGSYAGGRFVASPVYAHTYAFGKHLTGDTSSGAVYVMSSSYTSDGAGRLLRRLRRAPHLVNEGSKVVYDRLQLDLETGLGVVTGQGADPQIMLRWSDDGGQTWSAEHWASAGAMGAYSARAIWRKLGAARDRVFEISMTDPIPWRIVDAWLRLRPGVA